MIPQEIFSCNNFFYPIIATLCVQDLLERERVKIPIIFWLVINLERSINISLLLSVLRHQLIKRRIPSIPRWKKEKEVFLDLLLDNNALFLSTISICLKRKHMEHSHQLNSCVNTSITKVGIIDNS